MASGELDELLDALQESVQKAERGRVGLGFRAHGDELGLHERPVMDRERDLCAVAGASHLETDDAALEFPKRELGVFPRFVVGRRSSERAVEHAADLLIEARGRFGQRSPPFPKVLYVSFGSVSTQNRPPPRRDAGVVCGGAGVRQGSSGS